MRKWAFSIYVNVFYTVNGNVYCKCCQCDVRNALLLLADWRFPEDHPQQGIRANLSEEEDGLRQLFLTLPFLLLTRQWSVLLLIIKETVEQVLVLETQLLVHLRADKRKHTHKHIKRHIDTFKHSCFLVCLFFISKNNFRHRLWSVWIWDQDWIYILYSCFKTSN